MKATLEVINRMQADAVIGKYAIGGAIGASFYLEPVSTFDLDIFIAFRDTPRSSIVSLGPIYAYLEKLGYKAEQENIMIEGWPVQFLPADDPLCFEALEQAVSILFSGVNTWVMTAEHLMAIALKTGRRKDLLRLDQFVNSKSFNEAKWQDILARHNLLEKWKRFKQLDLPGDDK